MVKLYIDLLYTLLSVAVDTSIANGVCQYAGIFFVLRMFFPCISPTDINECVLAALNGTDNCEGTMFCVNTMGAYECECPGGTELVDGSCREISTLLDIH